MLVENSACGVIGHRCSKSISVFYMGGLITMEKGEVCVTHTRTQTPLFVYILYILLLMYLTGEDEEASDEGD